MTTCADPECRRRSNLEECEYCEEEFCEDHIPITTQFAQFEEKMEKSHNCCKMGLNYFFKYLWKRRNRKKEEKKYEGSTKYKQVLSGSEFFEIFIVFITFTLVDHYLCFLFGIYFVVVSSAIAAFLYFVFKYLSNFNIYPELFVEKKYILIPFVLLFVVLVLLFLPEIVSLTNILTQILFQRNLCTKIC